MKKDEVEKKEETTEEETTDDVVFDEEITNEESAVKKLRARLKKCEEEKHAYLDGWQRLKADIANNKKRNADLEKILIARSKEEVISSIIPVLDSFDMAFTGEKWQEVDELWRTGVENIHSQLLEVLSNNGYSSFGEVGEKFDANLHEAIEQVDGEGEAQTIAKVIRKGYKNEQTVVRPAQVAVYN